MQEAQGPNWRTKQLRDANSEKMRLLHRLWGWLKLSHCEYLAQLYVALEWKLVVRTPRKPETFFDLYSFGPHSYDPNPCLFQRRRWLGPLFFRLLFRKYSGSKTKTRHADADKSFLQRLSRYFHQRMPAGRLTGRCGKLRPFPVGFPWFLSILEHVTSRSSQDTPAAGGWRWIFEEVG